MVQFYPWFKFYLLLFQMHYHIITIPENKRETKDEIEPQHLPIHMEDFHT